MNYLISSGERSLEKYEAPTFVKPRIVIGRNLIFCNALQKDADFIVSLRTDARKSRYISKTSNDLDLQVEWLRKYESDNSQIYFIILNEFRNPVGTVRLYDQRGASFCWGSWILMDGVPGFYAIESALIVYHYALSLGFIKAHFDVRKGNSSVRAFHERFGAIRVAEDDINVFYEISEDCIKKSLQRYGRYLPNGIAILDV